MKNIRNLKKAGAVICTICMLLSLASAAFADERASAPFHVNITEEQSPAQGDDRSAGTEKDQQAEQGYGDWSEKGKDALKDFKDWISGWWNSGSGDEQGSAAGDEEQPATGEDTKQPAAEDEQLPVIGSKHNRNLSGSVKGNMEKGEKITLTAELDGYDDVDYDISWQYRVDNGDWQTIKGAKGTQYTFTMNEETDGREWRVVVTYEDEDE